MSAFVRTQNLLTEHNIKMDFVNVSGNALIGAARNELATQALDTGAGYILFVDTRQLWEPVGVLRMIADLDMVDSCAAPTGGRTGKFFAKLTDRKIDHLTEAEHTSIAFFGIRESVLRKLRRKAVPYKDKNGDRHYDVFSHMIVDEEYIGEDISFTKRLVQAGFGLYVDEGIKVQRIII